MPERNQTESTAAPLVPHVANRDSGYPPLLQASLDRIRTVMGFIPDSVAVYLHRPEITETLLRFNASVTSHPSSTLDRLLKRKIALICSTINGCAYCTAHQCSYLSAPPGDGREGWGLDRTELEALVEGVAAPADEFERVCFDFARAASIDSSSISPDIRERLRKHLSPAQIVELAVVVGHWKLMNTLNDSLGLPIERINEQHTGYVEIAQSAIREGR